jgi:hypothetical protein
MTAFRKTSGIVLAAAAASLFSAGSVVVSPIHAWADGLQCSVETCDEQGECVGTVSTVETSEDCDEAGGVVIEG